MGIPSSQPGSRDGCAPAGEETSRQRDLAQAFAHRLRLIQEARIPPPVGAPLDQAGYPYIEVFTSFVTEACWDCLNNGVWGPS
jgi:hypothetical protein